MTTTAHQRDRDQEQRASLALNELEAARDAIHAACDLLGTTAAGLGLERALEDLAAVLSVPTVSERPRRAPMTTETTTYTGEELVELLTREGYTVEDQIAAIDSLIDAGEYAVDPDTGERLFTTDDLVVVRDQLNGEATS